MSSVYNTINLTTTDAVIVASQESHIYVPIANESTYGVVKIGTGLSVNASTGQLGVNIQTSWGSPTSDTKVPSEKLVKDSLDTLEEKVDDLTASDIAYASTTSGMAADNVQTAIDTLDGRLDTAESTLVSHGTRISTNELAITNLSASVSTLNSDKADKTEVEYVANKVTSIGSGSNDTQYPSAKAVYSSLPKKTSDITNDSGFITNSVNDLVNYYTKTNTYTKTEVNDLISGFSGELKIEYVTQLPTASAQTDFTVSHTFYFLQVTGEAGNRYEEYITKKTVTEEETTYSWEMIGSARVDLSDYYTKTQTDAKILEGDVAYIGREQLIGFNITSVSGGVATAELDSSLSSFEFTNSTGYLFNIVADSTVSASITDATELVLQDNDGNTININCVFQRDKDETSTFSNLKQVTTSSSAGMQLEFYGRFTQFVESGTTYRNVYTDTVVNVEGGLEIRRLT